MKIHRSSLTLAILLGATSFAHATVIGFGQLGGNNSTVPVNLGSTAVADGNGVSVSNGATPNITLTWDSDWDIHTSGFFGPIENQTMGGGDWDNEGGVPRVGQLDFGTHTISLAADPGYAVVLNSFDFGHTDEAHQQTGNPTTTTSWRISLTDTSDAEVWFQEVDFTDGQVETITPGFVGANGESYTLRFNRTAESYGSNGRHGIDNLSFNQIAVPEPGSAALLGLAGMTALLRRRK